ncbi:hypothetical protein KBA63_00645 [Candidatus Woesebacteria bacterium]|nr:hypothetical protein [Candidatus Woesebacteria bacterium]
MAKFKKGDRVKILDGGTEGFITCDDGSDWMQYRVDNKAEPFGEDELEFIEQAPKKGKFKTKDSGKRQTFDTGMNRDVQEGKARYDLVYSPMLKRWAELMARGAEKYGERNWEKAETEEEFNRFKSSAFRHFMQYMDGETDEDHAAAVMFNISGMEHVKSKQNEK